jgi:hypothetical protein
LHIKPSLSDLLLLNTPYQKEETIFFKNEVRAKRIGFVPPEYIFDLIESIEKNRLTEPIALLGYYSHASWVRKEQGHTKIGIDIEKMESSFLKILGEDNSLLSSMAPITIFCHPREKQLDLGEVNLFYRQFLSAENFQFPDFQLSSSSLFYSVEYGICTYSSVMFERLFCGFKTFIYTPDKGENEVQFPLPSSSIRNICFSNMSELRSLIAKNNGLSRKAFFEKNELNGYPYWDFDNLVLKN